MHSVFTHLFAQVWLILHKFVCLRLSEFVLKEDKAVSVCWFWVCAPWNVCQRATGENGGGWGEKGLHDVRGPAEVARAARSSRRSREQPRIF